MRVLLVDPDTLGRALAIGDVLAARGYELTSCANTDTALSQVAAARFDLVVAVTEPATDGACVDVTAFGHALRAAMPEGYLLVGVGSPDPGVMTRLLEAGFDDGFFLPFEAQRFGARLCVVEHAITQRSLLRKERGLVQSRLLLTDRLVSVGTLAAGVAHEINNPLMYVIANLEFVSRALATGAEADDERRRRLQRAMTQAREGADRVRQIVRNLRTFSRGDEDRRGPVSVKDILESSIDMAWNEIRHRAQLVRDYQPVSAVEANEARLGQVFLNLLVNAAHSIPEGEVARHQVRVSTRATASTVIVEVSDSGTGIPADILGRIFDPFFTTKPIGEGTGLGLSICHGIVSGLGGQIEVESEPGHGSTFRVVLPSSGHGRVEPRSSTPPAPTGARARVLVVDDEANLRVSLTQILASEHEVRDTASGREVIEMIRAGERFDVILCDLMMPEMSGVDLFAALQSIAPEQAARVVFLTGGAFTPRAQEFLGRVQNPRLEKPFEIDELLLLIRKVMR